MHSVRKVGFSVFSFFYFFFFEQKVMLLLVVATCLLEEMNMLRFGLDEFTFQRMSILQSLLNCCAR